MEEANSKMLNSGGEGRTTRARKRRAGADQDVAVAADDGESNSIMKKLPNEIKLDILSRLPFDKVLDCKLVCKSWCTTIQNPSFGKIHLRHSTAAAVTDDKVSFLFQTVEEKTRLYYGIYYENSCICMKLKTVNHPLITKHPSTNAMVGSCNGLVCFSVPVTYNVEDPVYICNPVSGELVLLPRFTVMARNKHNVEYKKTTYLKGGIVSGFGYNPVSDEYKVVRIYYAGSPRSLVKPKGQVQVYTLGSGTGWRSIGECPYALQCDGVTDDGEFYTPSRGFLVDGALHWLDEAWNVVSFNLTDEMFRLLPSPPCFHTGEKNFYTLQVLRGSLCVVSDYKGKRLDIWSFNKENSGWEKMFGILCRSKRFMDVYWPISLTPSGNLLLRYNYWTLYRYDPQAGELIKLTRLDLDLSSTSSFSDRLIEALPHMNSFVSLKALGEKCTTIERVNYIMDRKRITVIENGRLTEIL